MIAPPAAALTAQESKCAGRGPKRSVQRRIACLMVEYRGYRRSPDDHDVPWDWNAFGATLMQFFGETGVVPDANRS